MYRRYLYRDISPKSTYVVGDGHGQWKLLFYKIKQSQLSNCILILAGDNGFGFEKMEYNNQIYRMLSSYLKKMNVHILCIRGNHDDPAYYDGKMIDFPYFKAIPDYSIITVGEGDSENNILCIGGGISIDRVNRMSNDREKRKYGGTHCSTYYPDEIPTYNPNILDKIYNDGVTIKTVVTHTAPKFAPLQTKENLEYWMANDPNLSVDIDNERETLSKIYDHIVKKDRYNVRLWCYGHFHQHMISYSEENIKFIMLDMMWGKNNSWDITPIELENHE